MHAFLIVGADNLAVQTRATRLASDKNFKLVDFTIRKVEDVRQFNKFVRLTLAEPTAYLFADFHLATEEAQNAFLKTLEEPQSNLKLFLTSPNESGVLPTILSRCQIIRVADSQTEDVNGEIITFDGLNMSDKLAFVDKIKDRQKAIAFLEQFLKLTHKKLLQNPLTQQSLARNSKTTLLALDNIKKSGNITLQLANFVINLI